MSVCTVSTVSTVYNIYSIYHIYSLQYLQYLPYLQYLFYSIYNKVYALSTLNMTSPCRPTIVGGWRNQALDTMLVLDECEEDDDLTR